MGSPHAKDGRRDAPVALHNYPQNIISSAICIDECTASNGTIHIWPGSHVEHLEHERNDIGLEVKPGLIDPEGGIDLIAPAGSVMLFHALLIHNSKPNTSGKPRRLMIYSHYPSSFEMCPDVRNGPGRLRESPYEWEYIRMREAGAYTDLLLGTGFLRLGWGFVMTAISRTRSARGAATTMFPGPR